MSSIKNIQTPMLISTDPAFFQRQLSMTKKYRYENMMTPYEKLKSLPNAAVHLRPGLSFDKLDAIALSITDDEAATRLQEAKTKLFNKIDDNQLLNTVVANEQP